MTPYKYFFTANRVHPHVRLQQKLYRCVPQLSPTMAAVLGYIVGREYIEPRIGELAVTSDGGVIARLAGEATFTHFVCDYDELIMTWVNVLVAARLTEAEKLHAASLFAEKIGFCGQSQA